MTWLEIYTKEINKKGGLSAFISGKEKRSAGALISRLRKCLLPNSRILEVGTGTGAIGALLIKYGFKVVAVDNDPDLIETAKKSFSLYGPGLGENVIFADANNICEEFGKDTFDCVISHGMLEHYPDDQILSYLNKQLMVAPLAVFVVPMKSMSHKYQSRGLGDERYLQTRYWKKLLSKNYNLQSVFGFGFKETKYPRVLEKLIRIDFFSKIFAPLCAFNEFWITSKK
jgi:2-polyprenyl-3-methyl-5-hydroxy-6-metoxy-1,4-benzoquinol methylase